MPPAGAGPARRSGTETGHGLLAAGQCGSWRPTFSAMRVVGLAVTATLALGCGSEPAGEKNVAHEAGSAATTAASAASSASVQAPPPLPPETGNTLSASGPLTVSINQQSVTFTRAVIGAREEGKGLRLTVGTDALSCANVEPPTEKLVVDVAPGPDGDFYAGRIVPAGLEAFLGKARNRGKDEPLVPPHYARMRLGPLAAGEKVKVELEIDYELFWGGLETVKGGGVIEATVCKGDEVARLLAAPKLEAAPPGPVRGTLGGRPFEVGSVLAFLTPNPRALVKDVELHLYENKDASCVHFAKSALEGGGVNGVAIRIQPGLSSKRLVLGKNEPAPFLVSSSEISETRHFDQDTTNFERGGPAAVVQIDAADFSDKGYVAGRVVLDTRPFAKKPEDAVQIAGRFRAPVCPMKGLGD